MTNRKEKMNSFKEEMTVIFRDYLKSRSVKKNSVQLIVEGKDDPKYYVTRFNNLLNIDWNVTSVGGKNKVIALKEIIEKHRLYKKDKCYYFVDKDFDKKITMDKVYCTPTYSIENFYLFPDSIKNTIISECGLSSSTLKNRHQIIEYILNDYELYLRNFHQHRKTIKINSVFKFIRLNQIKISSLDKVLKIEIITSDIKNIKLKHQSEYLTLRNENIIKYKDFLKHTDYQNLILEPLENFRGKQQILFLKSYLKRLYENGDLSIKIFHTFKVKIKLENPSMADKVLSNLSNYAHPPDCLKVFLSKINYENQRRIAA